ncbi:MAG: PKD domain-containing protein [bacterium]|nr:PKD domain-containing protein [bacterium]
MKKISEKIIASVFVSSLIFSLCLNIFIFRPKVAKATDAGGAIMNFIKEIGLDSIASSIGDMMMTKLEQNIYDWGMGKKSKINLPFNILDMRDYFNEALNMATGKFIEQTRLAELCTPIQKSFGERFSMTMSIQQPDRPEYKTFAGCSLNTIVGNVEAFVKDPKITLWGWDAWKALKTPNNNIFGSFFMAQDAKVEMLSNAKEDATIKAGINLGYKDETATAETNKEVGGNTCAEKYPANSVTDTRAQCQQGQQICTQEYSECIFSGDMSSCERQRMLCNAGLLACAPGVTQEQIDAQREECLDDVESEPEIPTQIKVKNIGSAIAEKMKEALKLKSDKLGVMDEITELVGVFFQALINKAQTVGLQALSAATQQATSAQRAKLQNKDTYSYLRAFTKTNTTTKKKDARSAIVAGMDKAIKSLSRSIINCGEKEVMHLEEFAKNLNGVLESNVEALYVGIQGVNVKSDATVLDPPYAPYSVYGYSWGEVFPSKVPDKCREILNQMHLATNTNCTDIISGLEPIYGQQIGSTSPAPQCNDDADNDGDGLIDFPQDPGCSSITDNSEVDSGGGGGGETEPHERTPQMLDIIPGFGENTCLPCMYDHDVLNCPQGPTPPQPYPGTSFLGIGAPSTVWTTTILQQKQGHYDNCHEWYDTALDRCDECTKAYNNKCSRLKTQDLKDRCIAKFCNNYAAISPYVIDPPTDALDFYNKCEIEEQKSACFTCLTEYFIPATYCEQTKDYAARMLIKYPAMVKLKRTGDNKGQFLGLFDQTISDMGGECNDNYDKKNISLALICRILPEFSYNGVKRCKTDCFKGNPIMTQAQLLNITDFRPDENDCGNVKLDVGGKEPFFAIDDGILESRGICCADFWQKSRKQYATCVGAGPTTGEPDSPTPIINNLSCTLSANPVSGLAPLNNVDLTVSASGIGGGTVTYEFDCNNDGTIERTQNIATVSDLCNYPLNNTTYTASATVTNADGNSATCTTNVQTTDCEITSTLNPANGIVPVATNITGRLNTTDTGPFTFRFYCGVPLDGGPIDSWTGETIEYVSNANPFTLTDACSFNSPGRKGIGVSITNNASGSTSSCYQVINVSDAPEIACAAENISSMVTTNSPVDIVTTAMPNSAYTSLIHNVVGTVFSYDCDNNGTFNNRTDIVPSTASITVHEATLYCSYPTSGTYTIAVRVGNTNPANGFSAFNTCETTVDVESSGAYVP